VAPTQTGGSDLDLVTRSKYLHGSVPRSPGVVGEPLVVSGMYSSSLDSLTKCWDGAIDLDLPLFEYTVACLGAIVPMEG